MTRTITNMEPSEMTINVEHEYLNVEGRYEDQYGHYLKFFQQIAEAEEPHYVANCPSTWRPFVEYMGHTVSSTVHYFDSCKAVDAMHPHYADFPDQRHFIEVVSTFRPELVDALWKFDMQWDVPDFRRLTQPRIAEGEEIIISNNGSYHRRELLEYFPKLDAYSPAADKDSVVLVPCAADKPYPAPLHSAVIERMPSNFYLANITGVLGVVPQDLWPVMPLYDSGIPNEWRLVNVATEYFKRNRHSRIVVYIDFYSLALKTAFDKAGVDPDTVTWINPVEFYADYLDLLDPYRLHQLEQAFKG
jgi:Domain of unknown function (DUF5591)